MAVNLLTVETAARAIRERELNCAELVEAALARAAETEPRVHAWASLDADGARRTATQRDAELALGRDRGPLHGIPVGLKDVIDTAGWPTEAGSAVLRGRVPVHDAEAVTALRKAGAIMLGKTVTHEFAYGQNTPPTRHPLDAERYPGGSSAGSGVAVAVGSALACLGTDTGGSIRNPAAINGIVGLKPTRGRLPRGGIIPVSDSLDEVGPLTRTVADSRIVFEAIAVGPFDAPRVRQRPLRIGVDPSAWGAISPAVAAAVGTALAGLVDDGVEIVDVSLPPSDLMLTAALTISLRESAMWHHDLLRARPRAYTPGTRLMLALGSLLGEADVRLARVAREELRTQLRTTFDNAGLDAVAGPTLPAVAPRLDAMSTDFTDTEHTDALVGALALLAPANLFGLPGLSVPCGHGPEGLPVGLHLLGRPFGEPALFNLGERVERGCARGSDARSGPRRVPSG